METIQIIIQQTLVMFLLIAVGYGLFRTGRITLAGSKDIASLLVIVVIPAVIFNSFAVEYTPEKARGLLLCTVLAAAALGAAMLVSHLFFRQNAIDDVAAAFSNAGFFGLPLITAALGAQAVLYAVPFIAELNILQFSYGVGRMRGERPAPREMLRSVLTNPIFLSTVAGAAIFFLRVPLPALIKTPLGQLANLNAPLAMLVLGVYLAQTDLRTLFTHAGLYIVSAVRLLIIPAVTLLLLWPMPIGDDMRQAMLIAAACPVGANVAVYAQLNGQDYGHAVQTVIHSTLLCIVSIPLILWAAQLLY